MENPGLPDSLWRELEGRLWHATAKDGLTGIAQSYEIRVSTAGHYKTSFCRNLGGVSLFDFGRSAVDDWNQFNNWFGWFGSEQGTRVAIWLEINRNKVCSELMDAASAHSAWKKQLSKTFIPGVEACHIGAIPGNASDRFLLIDRHNLGTFRIVDENWPERLHEIDEFEASLPPEPRNGIAARLNAARQAYQPKAKASDC